MKNLPQYKELQEALEVLEELKLPEWLQNTALEHLLAGKRAFVTSSAVLPVAVAPNAISHVAPFSQSLQTSSLRAFIADLKPKGAVSEIPCLLYWAKTSENADALSEAAIIELYRRAGLRPPKNVMQSLRDLCSKKYGRVEATGNGTFRISRVGEDFVLHDVKPDSN